MTNPSPIYANPDAVQRLLELSDPLITIEVLVEAIRCRFNHQFVSDPQLPWQWIDDPKTTEIFIESGYNKDIEARNVRPGVWVDRMESSTPPVSIGYQDQHPEILATGARRYYTTVNTDIRIDCTSPNRGESMLIASIVHLFLLMTRDPIMAKFAIREMSMIVVQRTTPFEEDRELWATPILLRVGAEVRWNVQPNDPLINAITLRVTERINQDSYRLMYLKSPENTPPD